MEGVFEMETKNIEIIEVEKPRMNLANLTRSFGMLIGLIIFGVGLVMCLSIVLIIPGLFGVLTGLVVMALNIPKAIVTCPACEFDNKANSTNNNVECERCKTNIPIKWKKEERSKRGFWTRSIFDNQK